MIFRKNKKYPFTNIYHCTVHKSGSQWIRSIFNDPVIKQYTGMGMFGYQSLLPGGFDPRKITDRQFYLPFPEGKIISPLYLSYDCYELIIKPSDYRTIYIYRDPRDLLISFYFSALKSHQAMGGLGELRHQLNGVNTETGLLHVIDYLEHAGYWTSLKSWTTCREENVLCIRYEDLIGDRAQAEFSDMTAFLRIQLDEKILTSVFQKYSFENMSGRKKGQESTENHLRKGIASDWKNYFSEAIDRRFREITGDLIQKMNYENR